MKPQELTLKPDVKTATDLEKLLGAINWVMPMLGSTTHQLKHLFAHLKGVSDLSSLGTLSEEAIRELDIISSQISIAKVDRIALALPVCLVLFPTAPYPTAVIGQLQGDKTIYLEWMFFNKYT